MVLVYHYSSATIAYLEGYITFSFCPSVDSRRRPVRLDRNIELLLSQEVPYRRYYSLA